MKNLLLTQKRLLYLVSCLSFLLLSGCGNTVTTTDYPESAWKVIGPGGGGGIMKPTISPIDENIVMYHCDMTAAYITLDGGHSWKINNLWNVPEDFEFDPVDEHTIYVATRGFSHSEDRGSGFSMLYRTTDKGKKWEIIFPDVKKADKKFEKLQSYDLKPSDVIPGAIDGTIDKIAVDPLNNRSIYLGLASLKDYMSPQRNAQSIDSAMLVHSDNKGKTWNLIARLPGENVRAVFSPGKTGLRDEVLVFTESACVRINMRTKQAKQLNLPVNRLIAVEGGKGKDGSRIFIQAPMRNENGNVTGGMYVSKDNGDSWTQVNNGLLTKLAEGRVLSFRTGLAVCETQPDVAYISVVLPEPTENGAVVQVYSIYKTTNSGADWIPVLRSSSSGGYMTNKYDGSWLDISYGPGWGGAPIDLGVAPTNPDICYAGDNGRGYKTIDGGKTWKQVYSHAQPDGSYTSSGLDVTTCYGIHFDPFDKNHFFICYTDMGLFHTYNSGSSWFHSLKGVPNEWVNTCYDLKFDPTVKGRVWAVWANAHDLPRTKMFSPRGFGNYKGGVTVSDDGGRNWRTSNNGMSENSICTSILVDPTSPENARTLYVGIFDKGVYKSTDGGENWKDANNGLGDNLLAWQIRKNSEGRLFVLCARGLKDNNTVDGEIYYSDDQAVTWQQMALPKGVNGPHDLLIDPENGGRMYLSCWPRKTNEGDKNGGVYKTEDGGKSWKQVFDERYRVNAADVDPTNSSILYINTFQNSAFRSADFGENWKRIEGYRFKWGQRPVVDPHNPGMLFLSTYGGSVFYGPAEGEVGAFEGIVNLPDNWW